MPERPIIVFDVNETLLDLQAIRPVLDWIFSDPAAMRLWFAGLITYSEALTLAAVYAPFTGIGGAVLRMLAAARGMTIRDADGAELTGRFRHDAAPSRGPRGAAPAPRPWLPAVHAHRQHAGDLGRQLDAAGVMDLFERRFSVDETVRRHKPAPEAYQSVAAALQADPGDICLIASHVWDTLGAVAASWQAALILHAGKRPGLGGTVTTSENPAYSHDDDGYVLGHTSGEYQRQRWQARLWEDVTARLLEQVGARAGLRCLDVGCGSGEVMRLMAGLVAATGQVTGIDRDDRLGQEALHVLRDTVPGRFAFMHADVETADAVPGGPFDLVFARFLLVFARDPAALVRKLYAWTRPGGVLLMQEYDPRTFDIEPRLDTWDEFERVLYGSFRRAGAHPHVGRQLPHLFAAAGLGSPDGTDVAGLLTPLHDILPLYEAAYHSLRPAALRSGLTTEAAGEAFLAELAEAADRPDTTAMAPLVISAWKHKPSIPGT